jgi:uncharacterized protein (TIGR02147 family)
MKTKSVFEFGSYKTFMAYMLSSKSRRGQLTRAAEALQCQRSYLSRVISENLHLTPDHAFKLSKFFGLNATEREFFQALVDLERAGDPEYRSHLKQKVAEMKKRHESIQERTARTHLSIDALQASYFSSWAYSAIHFLTSIPEYQTIEAIGARLSLRPEFVLSCLQQLQKQQFVEERGKKWIYKSGEFHVAKDSPLVVLHHQNWRARAVIDAQDFGSNGVHFTAVQTVSHEDFTRLKEMLLQFISDLSQVTGPSKPEEGVAITFDFFKI